MKQLQLTAHATITIKPTASKLKWYNNYVVPSEIQTKTAIKELEKIIKEVGRNEIIKQTNHKNSNLQAFK